MKVLFVNNQHQLGGAETVVQQLRSGLERAGHLAPLYVAHGKSYPRDAGVFPLYPRLLSRLSHSRFQPLVERLFPRAAWTDSSFLKLADQDADLIHLHNFHGDYATIQTLAQVAARRPFVWTFHAFWGITGGCDHPGACHRYQQSCGQCPQVGQWPVGPIDKTAEQLNAKLTWLANRPLHIVAPSRHLAARVRESQVGKTWRVHHIPNGVDPSQFSFARKRDPDFRASLGLDAKAVAVLIVNRNFQDPQKGYPLVREALAQLEPENLQLVLAGLNSDWACAQLPAGFARVDAGYLTSRTTLAKLFEAADIFLFASPAENFPCVILEAMSAKCCVVSTPTSGVTEQITHGTSGFLSEEITGPSLGKALREALPAADQCHACGESARGKVEQEFSEALMIGRHLKLYEQLVRSAH